jgi:peptidyl-prolyl cis-trans isomerase C
MLDVFSVFCLYICIICVKLIQLNVSIKYERGKAMKKLILVVFMACIVTAFGCARKPKEDVIATVNNKPITVTMLNEKIEKLPEYYQAFAAQHKKEIVDEIIVEELLYNEAKRRKLQSDPDMKELISDATRKILISKVIEDETKKSAPVSDDDVKDYYEQNKEKYMVPEMVRASHILTSTEEEAIKAKGELDRGADFTAVAGEYSKDLTKDRGGDLGYFKKGQMIPEFENAAFSLKPGQTSDIVKTRFGYHIIRVTDYKPATYRNFEEVEDNVRTSIMRDRQRQSFDDFTKILREKSKITINQDVLQGLEQDIPEEEKAPVELPE